MRRLLALPAVAALIASATLLGIAGTASASTAGTASASVATTAAAAQQPNALRDELVFGGYYGDSLDCAIAGAGSVGLVLSGGTVYDYECIYNGEPGPLGPYELWLFVSNSCPGGSPATPARVAPGVKAPASCA